ncbi:PQQ-dependent sugar dehydrogenase [Wenxinia marina]|uniref:Glucose/sorbosone dehydrogenase n=1 Tax=Wenxinia marina DSM 24838 TaxID=1123501 RepID=A0A0D0Q321_9RHOB|nr:sorbosone dehydrogenase family protein [Wenxinia marina]KIQ68954.1 Glucose/sorbosone dehydrogenase [Wenxinia marina DSM 24838]GGL63796.1 sorbosone dehydrogenase [Wenxinia marina]
MAISDIAARGVALIGAAAIRARRFTRHDGPPAVGGAPDIPEARKQRVMTLKMPTAKGWEGDHRPTPAPGLKVTAFARDLQHPRWIEVLPNGDTLVAEAIPARGKPKSAFDYAAQVTMARAGAMGTSANRITLYRGLKDGVAQERHTFREGLNQPFGMALVNGTFYVGNTDGVLAFDHAEGATRLQGPGRPVASFKPGGHWTRSLLASPDGTKLYAGVGSLSNIGDMGMEAEEDRAAIHEIDLATGTQRIFAGGLRNPVGLAWEPSTGALWTVVNERDGLGDETPPDYLTSVKDGAFYGWPWCYWDRVVDDRVPANPEMVAKALTPDYALGGHTACLGLAWVPEGTLPGVPAGMAIGQHGSWNRATLSGYRVIHVPFSDGKPSGPPRDLLTGFLSEDEKWSYGRPVGVAVGADARSLLVADDVGNVIWRIAGA